LRRLKAGFLLTIKLKGDIMGNLLNRMLRAAKLDAGLYEEVEADKEATVQAVIVVVLSSLAAGIGSLSYLGVGGVIAAIIFALIGWYIWAYLTFLIGTKLLPEPQTEADVGQMLRTIGFSSSPGLIRILGFIPGLNWIINLIASIWMLVAMIIAVRQALDYKGTLRAVLVCLIGFIIYMIIMSLIGSLFGSTYSL
jgi:hypothetical protein